MDQIIQEAIKIYNTNKVNGPAMAIFAAIKYIRDNANVNSVEAKSIFDEAMKENEEYQQIKSVAKEKNIISFKNAKNIDDLLQKFSIGELLKYADSKLMILMRGVSGSGKSHKARRLVEDLGGKIFSTDNYPGLYTEIENDYPIINLNLIGEAHQWNQSEVEKALQQGISPIIVDNTNTQSWEMREYVKLADKYGYDYKIETPDSPWWTSLFSEDMSDKDKEQLINELYDHTQHIPKPLSENKPDIILNMLNRWEHNPSKEDILTSKAPWEE